MAIIVDMEHNEEISYNISRQLIQQSFLLLLLSSSTNGLFSIWACFDYIVHKDL